MQKRERHQPVLKEWVAIHKIKALHNEGAGLSIRSIARELGISRNTVRKYLRMDEGASIRRERDRGRTASSSLTGRGTNSWMTIGTTSSPC